MWKHITLLIIFLTLLASKSFAVCSTSSCYLYFLAPYSIDTVGLGTSVTSNVYSPSFSCNGNSFTGFFNQTTEVIQNPSRRARAYLRVYSFANNSWSLAGEFGTVYYYLPQGASYSSYLPPSFSNISLFSSAPTDPNSSCSNPQCPNPLAEQAFKDSCPFGLGVYDCWEPSNSTCQIQNCAEVGIYTSANYSTLCPGDPIETRLRYTCTDSPFLMSSIECNNCTDLQNTWANLNCGGLAYLAQFDCNTDQGQCLTCDQEKTIWAEQNCGSLANLQFYDCSDHGANATCKTCEDREHYYGEQNCGGLFYAKTISCELNQFQCKTCEEKALMESTDHCRGPNNLINQSIDCASNIYPCDCEKMKHQWGVDNSCVYEKIQDWNCQSYSATCLNPPVSPLLINCNDYTNNCISNCGGIQNVGIVDCHNGLVHKECACKDNQNNTGTSISNGISDKPSSILPSPSSSSNISNNDSQNTSQIVDNTNAINNTLAAGLNTVNESIDKVNSSVRSISDSLDTSGTLLDSSLSYDTTIGDVEPNHDFNTLYSNSSSFVSTFTQNIFRTDGIQLSDIQKKVSVDIKGKSISIDFEPYENYLIFIGNILYLCACITSLFIIFG